MSTENGKVGNLYIEICADTSQLDKSLKGVKSALQSIEENANKSTTKLADSIGKIGSKMTKSLTLPLAAAGGAAIKFASDLEETQQKVDVVFGESADIIKDWASTSIEQMGLASETAMSAAATYANMADGMGLTADTGLEMSMTLTQLSADLASFNNTSQETAQIALNSIFTGETETLKQYGVVMTEANLQQFAMQQGIKKSVQQMSQAEKVQLRYNFVMAKTTNAQGDFARTSDSVANKTRVAKERLKEVATTLGQNLLPAASKILDLANDLLEGFNDLDEGTQKLIIGIAGVAAAAGPVLKVGSNIYKGATKVIDSFKKMSSTLNSTAAASAASSTALAATGTAANGASVGVTTFGTALKTALPIIGLVAAGVTGLITILSSLDTPDEEIQKLADSAKTLKEETESAREENEKQIAVLKRQKEQTPGLIDQLYALETVEGRTTNQKIEMSRIVRQLNSDYEGLGLSIDNNTGKLNKTRAEVEKTTDAIYELNYAQTLQKTLNDENSNQEKSYIELGNAIQKLKTYVKENLIVQDDYILSLNEEEIAAKAINGEFDKLYGNMHIYSSNTRAIIDSIKDTGKVFLESGEIIDYTTEELESANKTTLEGFAENSAAGEKFTRDYLEQMQDCLNATTTLNNAERQRYQNYINQGMEQIALEEQMAAAEQVRLEEKVARIQETNQTIDAEEAKLLENRRLRGEQLTEVEQAQLDRYKEIQDRRVEAVVGTEEKINLSKQRSIAKDLEIIKHNKKMVEQSEKDLSYLRTIEDNKLQTYLDSVDQYSEEGMKKLRELAENAEKGGGELTGKSREYIDTMAEISNTGLSKMVTETDAKMKENTETAGKNMDETIEQAEEKSKELEKAVSDGIQKARNEAAILSTSSQWDIIGYNMIAGMVTGVKDGTGILRSAVRNAVRSAVAAAKEAADIHSPSKLFEKEVGAMMSAGIAAGVTKNTQLVTDAVNSQVMASAFEVNPVIFRDVGAGIYNSYGRNNVNINVSLPMNITKSLTDAEITRKARTITNIVSREFAKATGGKMN